MAWRLHLTNQAIQRLDIFSGKPPLLAAWLRRDKIAYYELESGAPFGEQTLPSINSHERTSEEWLQFVGELIAPNRQYLPLVRTPHLNIHSTEDGRMRLYHTGDTEMFLETEGKEVKLHAGEAAPFAHVEFDPLLGMTVALDEKGKLHVYQQNIRVGHFELGFAINADVPFGLAIARGGSSIYAAHGQRIVSTSSSGKTRRELDVHYYIGKIACSPNGRLLATSDLETSVIRLYNGSDLSPLYQRFAIDLLAEATQVQLLADLPPAKVALSAMTIDDEGVLAFAMSGVICVTDATFMDELPRPQRLF
jgi:hypothetical protein